MVAPGDASEFDRKVALALRALDVDASRPAVDGIADPAGARAALATSEDGAVVLVRALPELGGATPSYAPVPGEPLWIRLEVGSPEVTVSPITGGTPSARRASRVVIEMDSIRCCDASTCSLEKVRTAAWLVLEGEAGEDRVMVAEALDASADASAVAVRGLAETLGRLLGVPVEPEAGGREEESEVSPARGAIAASRLARFALRLEGTRLVLRDHSSAGPRERVRRLFVAGALSAAVAAGFWALVARSAAMAAGTGAILAFGALAVLLSLTAYAFLVMARFAARYGANSNPLLWLGHDRLTAAPWVSRTGAVDVRPEGRFGASIPLGEFRAAGVLERDGRHVIQLDTDHGPFEVLATADPDVAAFWCEAIRRAAKQAAHPEAKVSARQRARERAR